jgi:protein subunit release factor B
MEKILSITKKDFEVQTFRSGGKGGQNQNKVESGVRIIHKESGAVGESRRERSQGQNKKLAFEHLIKTPKFKVWLNRKIYEINCRQTVEEKVNEQMNSKNLSFEVKEGKMWTKISEAEIKE